MGFYDDMQGVASDILRDFNQGNTSGSDKMQYVELVSGNGPADNPGAPTEVLHPITGVAKGVEEKYINGTQIVMSDGQITCEVGSFVPKAKNFVIVGGKRHKIEMATQIPPTGTPVAYIMIYKR